jgi:GTP-binding protein
VVSVDDLRSFVIADIPGVIEGAAEGAGLGLQFLKHLSRTGLLLHIVDIEPYGNEETPVESAQKIIYELKKWGKGLSEKPRWLILNKTDFVLEEEVDLHCQAIIEALQWDGKVFQISAISKQGTRALMFEIMDFLEGQRRISHDEG